MPTCWPEMTIRCTVPVSCRTRQSAVDRPEPSPTTSAAMAPARPWASTVSNRWRRRSRQAPLLAASAIRSPALMVPVAPMRRASSQAS